MSTKIEDMGKKIKTYIFVFLMVMVAVGMAISMIGKSSGEANTDTISTKEAMSVNQEAVAVSTPKSLEQSQREKIRAKILSELSPVELAVLNGKPCQDKTDFTAYIEMTIRSGLAYIEEQTKDMNEEEYKAFMKEKFSVDNNSK